MAKRLKSNSGEFSKKPTFSRGSKMRRYDIIFDEDVNQHRAGFFKKDLYKFDIKNDDLIWTVEPGFEHRTDLISARFYGTSRYAWVLEEINDVKDPIKDVVVGKKLKIPSQSRMITTF